MSVKNITELCSYLSNFLSFPLILLYILFLTVCLCGDICMWVRCLQRPEDPRELVFQATVSCQHGCYVRSLGPLQKQYALLAAESTLQVHWILFYTKSLTPKLFVWKFYCMGKCKKSIPWCQPKVASTVTSEFFSLHQICMSFYLWNNI